MVSAKFGTLIQIDEATLAKSDLHTARILIKTPLSELPRSGIEVLIDGRICHIQIKEEFVCPLVDFPKLNNRFGLLDDHYGEGGDHAPAVDVESEKSGNSNSSRAKIENSVELPKQSKAVAVNSSIGPPKVLCSGRGSPKIGRTSGNSQQSKNISLEEFEDYNPFGPIQKPSKKSKKALDLNIPASDSVCLCNKAHDSPNGLTNLSVNSSSNPIDLSIPSRSKTTKAHSQRISVASSIPSHISDSVDEIPSEAAKTWEMGQKLGVIFPENVDTTCGRIEALIRKDSETANKGKEGKKRRGSKKLK